MKAVVVAITLIALTLTTFISPLVRASAGTIVEEVPRHPSSNSTLFGAPVLTSNSFKKMLLGLLSEIDQVEKTLENASFPSPIATNCSEVKLTNFTEGWRIDWIYVNPSPLITKEQEKLFNSLIKHISLLSLKTIVAGVKPDSLVVKSKNVLPLIEVSTRLKDMIASINKKDFLRYEFDYVVLAVYYISLSAWGPGEYLCKSYISSSKVLIVSSKSTSSSTFELTYINMWYVPDEIAECLRNWNVPGTSKVVEGDLAQKVIERLRSVIKRAILYIPDYSMRFFIPVPIILLHGTSYIMPSSEGYTGNVTSIINVTSTSQSEIANVTLSSERGEILDIKGLARIASNIFSSMNTAGGEEYLGFEGSPGLPKAVIKVNVTKLINRRLVVPNVDVKKVGSVILRMFIDKSTISRLSSLRSNAGVYLTKIVEIKPLISSLIFVAAILILKDLGILSLRSRSLSDKMLASRCYKRVINRVSKYSGRKRAWETPREYLKRSLDLLPADLAMTLTKVTEIYEKVKYGNEMLKSNEKMFCIKVIRGLRSAK